MIMTPAPAPLSSLYSRYCTVPPLYSTSTASPKRLCSASTATSKFNFNFPQSLLLPLLLSTHVSHWTTQPFSETTPTIWYKGKATSVKFHDFYLLPPKQTPPFPTRTTTTTTGLSRSSSSSSAPITSSPHSLRHGHDLLLLF